MVRSLLTVIRYHRNSHWYTNTLLNDNSYLYVKLFYAPIPLFKHISYCIWFCGPKNVMKRKCFSPNSKQIPFSWPRRSSSSQRKRFKRFQAKENNWKSFNSFQVYLYYVSSVFSAQCTPLTFVHWLLWTIWQFWFFRSKLKKKFST